MSVDWSKFDKALDLDGFKKDIQDASQNKRQYDDVPLGKYEVSIRNMELKTSKKGDPMLTIQFKILAGQFKGQSIFMNQVCNLAFQTHVCNELLRSLGTGMDIEFDGYAKYSELVLDVFEKIEDEGLEYVLNYGENDKGYKTFEIEEVFES